MNLLNQLTLKIADGLQNNTLTSCSRWAHHRRIMGEPFPGPYSWKYHPWVKDMHDSKAPFNYAMKGAQLGVTEVLINLTFYTIDQLLRDVLYVLPTSKNASDFSKARFNAALHNSEYLNGIFTNTNSIELKQAGSNTLYIRGSKGDSNLKSIPVGVLLLDEVDEMSQRAISLALERLSGQLSKTVWGISTPTIPNFGIHKLFKGSTQEHFTFKCPRCGRSGDTVREIHWPKYRTEQYAIWRACARLGIRPPGVKKSWDECSVTTKAKIIAFDQISSHDELEEKKTLGAER